MRRFLILVILFGLIIVATLALGEAAIRCAQNPYKYKHEWMQQHAAEVETLIMGSSLGYYDIEPAMIENSFCLADNSQTFKYDLLQLKQYRPMAQNLKRVMIMVGYCSFFDAVLDVGPEWYYAINYKLYMGINEHSWLSKFGCELWHPSVYSGKLRSLLLGGEDLMCDSLGHGRNFSHDRRLDDIVASSETAIARHTAANWDAVAQNTADFEALIKWCIDEKIEPMIVLPPVCKAYRDRVDARQLSEMYRILNATTAKFGITYHDYYADPRFTDEDFYDADHLTNDLGAAKFTRLMTNDFNPDTNSDSDFEKFREL